METKRFYRDSIKGGNLTFFSVSVEQTDLFIGAKKNLYPEALHAIKKYRGQLEAYIKIHPDFLNSLEPVCPLPNAPLIAMDMCTAASLAGVGPMAAVAGAFSKFVGQELLRYTDEIIVENGGDIFMQSLMDRTIGIYAGSSPLNGELAIRISKEMFPCGVCTSSGTIGHSLSLGRADAALVLSRDASLSDACATALGNKIKTPSDIEGALNFISKIPGVSGALAIIGEAFGAWGSIEFVQT